MTITSSPSSPSLSCAIADIVAQTTDTTVAVTVALKPLGSDGEAETGTAPEASTETGTKTQQ